MSSKLSTKSYDLPFFHIWHYRIKGQGQFKVIIWAILVLLEYPMLHTNYQCHRLIGSGEDFESILTIFGHEDHDWHVIATFPTNFYSLSPMRLHRIWLQLSQWLLRIKMFGIVIVWESWVKGQIMTLTFKTRESSYTHLISQLYIPIFRPKSSKLSMKSFELAFFHTWLAVKRSRSTQGSHLNNLDCTCVVDTTYKVSRPSAIGSRDEDFWSFFPIFGMWPGDLGSSIWNSVIIGSVTLEEMLKIVKIWESWFKGLRMTISSFTHKSS